MTTKKQTSPEETAALKTIISSLGELPSSPAVVGLVMGMTADLNTDIKKLSRALSADQAIAAKTLRLSNSPLYGRPGGVGSVEEATLVLGFFTVRSLVVATATYAMFQTDDPNGPEERLWEHSLASAIGARLIARKIHHPAGEECYLAGLLHDVGKLILMQRFKEGYRELLREVIEKDSKLVDLEADNFGFNHTQLGAALLSEWAFPKEMTEAVADHHLRVEAPAEGPAPISIVVRLANELAVAIGEGFEGIKAEETKDDEETEQEFVLSWSAQALGLTQDDISELTESLQENFNEEKSLFL